MLSMQMTENISWSKKDIKYYPRCRRIFFVTPGEIIEANNAIAIHH